MAAELEKPEQKAANMLSLEKLNRALAPRLAKGYAAISMGMLRYRGYQIYLWKLEYKDGGDDDLAYGIVTMDGRFRSFGVRPPGFVQGSVLISTVEERVMKRDNLVAVGGTVAAALGGGQA